MRDASNTQGAEWIFLGNFGEWGAWERNSIKLVLVLTDVEDCAGFI